ncbi:hypothetical protein [Thermococcus zilligii]|uniref:hypothetical protein n=1 Tax=Thermococcus zilligii TaxID=54076 RepID=UPI00029B1E7E|nr:hypothetical protein [Thermococcus zilligii]
MKWKPLFAVLLGLLMLGVTAGSASATAMVLNGNPAPLQVRVSPLSVHDMIKIRSLVLNEIGAFGISKDELSLGNIHGYKAGSYSVFTIDTSKGAITGIYDGASITLSKVITTTEDNVVIKTVTDGRVNVHSYSKEEMQKLTEPFKRITYYYLPTTPLLTKNNLIQPDATFERHWWGWKVTFTEQETQDIVTILRDGSATAGAIAAYLASTGVSASIALAVAAALIASAGIIYAIDAIGGHKGIYVAYFMGTTWIWHN